MAKYCVECNSKIPLFSSTSSKNEGKNFCCNECRALFYAKERSKEFSSMVNDFIRKCMYVLEIKNVMFATNNERVENYLDLEFILYYDKEEETNIRFIDKKSNSITEEQQLNRCVFIISTDYMIFGNYLKGVSGKMNTAFPLERKKDRIIDKLDKTSIAIPISCIEKAVISDIVTPKYFYAYKLDVYCSLLDEEMIIEYTILYNDEIWGIINSLTKCNIKIYRPKNKMVLNEV